MTRRNLFSTLSLLWVAVVAVYMVWAGITETGLYYWAGTIMIDQGGGYSPMLAGMLPGILLGLPALVYIAMEARRERRAPPDPVAGARSIKLVARWMFGIGGACLIAGIACFLLALGQRSSAERAVPFDVAALGNGPAPAWKVELTGTTDATARTSVTDSGRFSRSTTIYAGFHAGGDAAKGAPFRVFIERWASGGYREANLYQGVEQDGYLIENGLPPLVLYQLEHQGVRIASPHYMLLTTSGGLREPYYVGAALGIFFGGMLIGIGTLMLVLPRRGVAGVANPRRF